MWEAAREQLVEDHPGRPDVRPLAALAVERLGGHVGQRAADVRAVGAGTQQARDAEVRQAGRLAPEQDVVGLEVAVDDATFVQV